MTTELVGGMTDAQWAVRREELDASFIDKSLHGPARALHAYLMINPHECERTDSAYTYLAVTHRPTIWRQLAAEWAERLGVEDSEGWQTVVALVSGGAKMELYLRGELNP